MAEVNERKVKVILPDGRKGNIPESRLDEFKQKYPDGQIMGYMGSPSIQQPELPKQQPIAVSDASMPNDTIQMVGSTPMNTELPPVDANNKEIMAQEYAQKQLKANTEEAYNRINEQAEKANQTAAEQRIQSFVDNTERREGEGFFSHLMRLSSMESPIAHSQKTMNRLDRNNGGAEASALNTATKLLKDSKNLIKDAEKEEGGTFLGGVGRGLYRSSTDIDNWTMGVSELLQSADLMSALKKYEAGEELSDGEHALLEAASINSAVADLYSDKLGFGYKAGKVTAEAIPFMIEFAANPLSRVGRTVSGRLAKYALSRGMGRASTKAMSYAGRVGADVVGANLMSLTTGSGRVVAGALDNKIGRFNYNLDDKGAIKFMGVEGGEDSWVRALGKSYTSNTITNFSEMLGAYFAPLTGLAGKQMSRFVSHFPKLKKVEDVFKTISNSDLAKGIKVFDRETQLSGAFGEFTEEIIDGLMQGVIVEEKSLKETAEDVFNRDRLIETLLGVSLLAGTRSALKITGAARSGFDIAQMYMTRAEKEARRSGINEDTWNYEKSKIDAFSSDEYKDDGYKELKSYLSNRSIDDALTTQQKVALFNYAKAVQQAKGISLVTQKAIDEGVDTYESAEPSDIQQEVQEKSPLEPTDEEIFLSSLHLSPADDIRYQFTENGNRKTDTTVRPITFKENGKEYSGYLIRETDDTVDGLSSSAEVVYIADEQTGQAQRKVIPSNSITGRIEPIQDTEFFSTNAALLREQQEKNKKEFENRNKEAIEASMTPEERAAYRQAEFNAIIRDNPDYDKGVYDSAFDLRGEEKSNLTEEQMFVVDKTENGEGQAIANIFYQRGLQEAKIANSVEKEGKMRQDGKDMKDIRKEQKRRRQEQGRLDAINKIIEERGLQTPESPSTPVSQQTSTIVPAVEDAIDGTQKPQTMLESVEGVLGDEREDVDKKYIDKSNITAPSEQNPILDTYNAIPRDKSGKVKIKDLSPEQMYSKVFIENGEQAANEMLQEEVDSINEEITKLREELPKKKGLQKAELYDKIGELESRLNSVQAIRPEQTTEATPTPGTAPVTEPEVTPEPEITPEPEVETQPEPIPDAEQKVVEEPVTEYAQQEGVKKKEKSPKEVKAKVLPKSMKELKKLSGDELKDTIKQMMQKGLVKFGSKRSWVEMFGERLEKVKDVNALMKNMDSSYKPQKKLYLAVRDLRSLIKETPDSTPQTEEATSPEVKEPVMEFEKKEKTEAKEKKQKKHISLAELRAMSADELKNTLIQLAQDEQIKIYRKNKGVRIGKTIYSKGVIDELLKRIEPKYEITKSIYNTKQKLREIAQIKPKSTETPVANEELDNAEEPIVNDTESKEEVYVTYKGKEVTLQSLIDTYRSLYDAVEKNKKKAKTAIGDIAQKYIPQEMKAIGDFLDENGIDRGVLDYTSGEKKAVAKKSETPKVKEEEQKPQETDNVIEDGYEVVEVTKGGKKEKRVMLNPDDYLKRRVYWTREELKKAKKEGKDKDTIKRLENEIQVLNKTAQERGIKNTKDARKGDAALAQEYANTPYGKREIEYYNNAQSFEYDVIEQPKSQSNWIADSIKKMAVELVKEIPNLNSETTTQQGTFAMKKVDDKNNLFVRVNSNGIAEYYYGAEKQPKSELFKPIEYDQRILTKEEKDFTKESIDSYADYLSAGEQMRAMKFEGLKVDEKKEVMAQRNIIRQKRDQWKKEHSDEIKEWQSKSSMRFEKSKPKDKGKSEEIELSAEDKAAIEEALSGEINLDESQGVLFNPKDYRFQVASKGLSNTRRATISEVKKLTDAIASVFPRSYAKVKILSDKKFNQERERLSGKSMLNDEGDVCGFVAKDGTIYINQDRARIDTPLHEIGIHKLMDLAKDTDNKDLIDAIFKYAKTAPKAIMDEVRERYPNLDPESEDGLFLEEVAAMAFGIQNEGRLEAILQTEAEKTWWKKLVEAVKSLWNKIAKTEPTYKDMSLYQGLSSLGHEEIGNKLFDMLTSDGVFDIEEKNYNFIENSEIYGTQESYSGGNETNLGIGQSSRDGGLLNDALSRIQRRDGNVSSNLQQGIRTEEDIDSRNREDEEVIERLSKEQGRWIDNVDNVLQSDYGEKIDSGSESFVYRKDNGPVIKSRSLVGYNTIQEALESIYIHNELFPETAMTVVGFGRSDGEFTVVFEQPYIGGVYATKEEIDQFIKDRFLAENDESVIGGTSYKTDRYLLQDLKPKNVKAVEIDGEKKFFVIDGDFYYNPQSITQPTTQESYSYNFPSNDELINGVLTRKGEERAQMSARSAAAIDTAIRSADCPKSAHPSAWINYFSQKGAIDTKGRNRIGNNLYMWLSKQNSMKVITRDDISKKNQELQQDSHPLKKFFRSLPNRLDKSLDDFITYIADADQSIREIQGEIMRLSGVSQLETEEDFIKNHNLESSRIANKIDGYEDTYQKELEESYDSFAKYNEQFESDPEIDRSYQDAVDRYLFALHAPERNRRINIDNLVEAAMDYARDIKITDKETIIRKWVTMLYDNEFVAKNGITGTTLSDNIDSKWKKDAIRVEKKLLKDLDELILDNNKTGENLSDAEAEGYVKAFEAITDQKDRDRLLSAVKKTSDYIVDEARNSGLITADTHHLYKTQYKHYVPLRSWNEEEMIEASERLDKSYFTGISSVTGEAEIEKKAKGRSTDAASPLATFFIEAQDTIIRGEKNRSLNALAKLFNKYRIEAEDMIYISDVEDIDKDDNAPAWVKEMAKQNKQEGVEHIIGIKVDGKNRRVYLAGDTGRRFTRAYKNLDSIEKSWFKRFIRWGTKLRSRIMTTYNPTFWISNTQRDVSGGIRNIYILRDAEYAKDLISNLGSSIREAFDANIKGKESDMYKLYLENGGSISYYKQREVKDIVKEVNKKAEKYIKEGIKENKAFSKALFETTANLASITEEMTRYSAFKTAVQHGESPAEAAFLAHEVTTNLSRRGSQRLFSNLYAFFNPTIQGVNQMMSFFSNPDTRKKAMVAYGADIAYTLVSKVAMMALAASIFNKGKDDDDDKVGVFDKDNPYWSINESTRNNTFAIPIGVDENGIPKCIIFQRPHQYRAISSIVDYGLESLSGRITPSEFLNKYLKRMISETSPFNPASYDGNIGLGVIQQATPTIIRPSADIAVNANSFGGKIRRDEYDESVPEYLMAKGSGVKVYTSLSKALNALGGGSAGIRGAWWLQVNPDDMKYFVDSYLGFGSKVVHSTINSLTRNEAEKERYGDSFASIFSNIYWENRDGAMYQATDKLREYANKRVTSLLNNSNPHLVKEFANDPKTMERIVDKVTQAATEMYSWYSSDIKELENMWNTTLSDEDMDIDRQNEKMQDILDGLVKVNTKFGKKFEDVLNDIIKEENR